MPLNLDQKKDLVKEVSEILMNADTILTADYRGLTSNQLNDFRKIARTPGIYIKVVKNNMLKKYTDVVRKNFLLVTIILSSCGGGNSSTNLEPITPAISITYHSG